MNADLKRVRDSSLDAQSPSSSKRRAIGSPGASSPSSGRAADPDAAEDEQMEDWMRAVESRRKEAIYRQMLDYRRAAQREEARANALERQRRNLEACFRAVDACWAQLVLSVRERAGRPGVPESDVLEAPLDPSRPPAELDSVLQERLSATLRLVAAFADAAAGKHSSDLGGDLRQQLERSQAESSTLRSSAEQLQAQIEELRQARDGYLKDLQRTEKKLDRQRMEFDKEREELRARRESPTAAAAATSSKPVANGSGHSTPNARASEAPDTKPVPTGGVATSSETEQRCAELEQLAQSRLQQLDALRAEHTTLMQELDKLKLQAHHPSEAMLKDAPFFQIYLQKLATEKARADAMTDRFEQAEKKLDQLRDSNLEFRDAVLAEARGEVETLRQQMGKKDSDLARLRGQRDDLNAELAERRARDTEKLRYADEMKELCDNRQERINWLCSEVRRLKGKLAAQDRAEGYLAFLKADGGVDGDYVKSLEDQLQRAKDEISALSTQLQNTADGDAAAAASETAVRTELESARRRLSEYERVLGPSASTDVKELGERLKETADAKKRLEMELAEAEASINAAYQELEGVTLLWEDLDKKLKTKVFELKDGELRMNRLNQEKAKADNKYFQAMRNQEGVQAECKTAQRSVEKQLKLLERAHEVERSLSAQIAQQEKSLTAVKNEALKLQSDHAMTTSEKQQLEMRLQQSQAALAEAQQLAHTRVALATTEKEARLKAQDELDSALRSVAKLKEKQEALTAAAARDGTSVGDASLKEERQKLLKLLRCSCCELNFKQQVITKCFHTFCKECLDQRIASRQRKCPACGLAFAKEDCQTLYWQ